MKILYTRIGGTGNIKHEEWWDSPSPKRGVSGCSIPNAHVRSGRSRHLGLDRIGAALHLREQGERHRVRSGQTDLPAGGAHQRGARTRVRAGAASQEQRGRERNRREAQEEARHDHEWLEDPSTE